MTEEVLLLPKYYHDRKWTHLLSTPRMMYFFLCLALADAHLQKFEKRKFNRINKKDVSDNTTTIKGDEVIGDLLNQNMILLPFIIDPHGWWGPILQNFLYHAETTLEYQFYASRPNAKIMFHRATTNRCPLGILKTADNIWKQKKQRTFFGHSYTAPTPPYTQFNN